MKQDHRLTVGLLGWLLSAWFLVPATARAHVGAPYPVLLEEPTGPYLVSALADPDVGQGTFYVLVALDQGQSPPPDTVVTVWVEPEDGHLPEASHPAEREQTRYGERFVAKVPFDAEGRWRVRLGIEGTAGQGETTFSVQVTPAGTGWLATLACLVPFLILGGLWLRGSLRQRTERSSRRDLSSP
jgi:hypothetical protein